MKYALKEWNTTIEALGKGQLIAIWRKGGISDPPNEDFNVKQNQFVLFPTFTHETQEKIKSEYAAHFDQKAGPNKDNQITIKYWAELEGSIEIETIDQLLNISRELINIDEHLVSSFNLNPSHKGKILLLRVHSLSDPILITNSPEYGGCKSWIELKIDIPRIGSKPILSYKDFSKKAKLIKLLIQETYQELPELLEKTNSSELTEKLLSP